MITLLKAFKAEIVCFAVISIFFLPLCGFLFKCGCTFLWSGALTHCNIHQAGSPDCPWCSGSMLAQTIPFIVVCAGGVTASMAIRRGWIDQFLPAVIAGLVSAVVIAFILAWIYANFLRYPQFIL